MSTRSDHESNLRIQSDHIHTPGEARTYRLLTFLWLAANLVFWAWWLQPERVGAPWLYALFSLAWVYETSLLPSAYLFFVGQMRRPRPVPAPAGLRVALITLCVPTQEGLEVILRQLEALVRVTYPHDSWVLDEGNDPSVRAAAERLGVRYFSRKDVPAYNQVGPPFKAKTKAGNVNAWLDAHGWDYDAFVQFDIDHQPRRDYLDRVLGYFRDERVAWVQAPSLYGNLDSWVARGAAEQELVLQGPLQSGFYGYSETPFIIGSHCTYRTQAIREIGGFQPTRAEDHLDTVMLAALGYKGVFVPEPIAIGGGPETFETYLRQQFAWAVSMLQVLGGYTPRLLGRVRPGQAAQFLFAQTWYPLWSMTMGVLFATPVVALLTGQEIAHAPLPMFLALSAPLQLTSFLIWRWTRRWQQPVCVGLSWRGIILHIARWPIVLWALVNVLLRVRHPYMITPKGSRAGLPAFSLRSQAIYLMGFGLSVAAVWLHLLRDPGAPGYVLFVLLGALYMLLVVIANVGTDLAALRRRRVGAWRTVRLRAAPLLSVAIALFGMGCTLNVSAPQLVAAAGWSGEVRTDPRLAGAGRARDILRVSAPVPPTLPVAPGQPLPMPFPIAALPVAQAKLDSAFVEHDAAPPEPPSTNAPLESPAAPELVIGAYDPWQRLDGVPLTLEHWYVPQDEPQLLAGALAHARQRRPLLMVTVEPFPHPGESMPVLERIVSGQSDDELRQLARIVTEATPQIVLVRWAHEMDLNILYPWAQSDAGLYRAAFRHVVEVFRAEGASNARWVWSPAGEERARAFYPGDDVVDYVGLTVLADAGWDAELGHSPRQSMADLLRPRYAAMHALGKPIVIAELGVSGTPAEQSAWLAAGAAALDDFPLVQVVVYFNDWNAPNNWRLAQPNWQLAERGALMPLLPNTARTSGARG